MKARFQMSILADGNTLSIGADATVAIRLPGTSTAATIYSNSTGTTTTNPLTADSSGNVACYVTPGRYDLLITTTDGTVTLSNYEISGVGVDVQAAGGTTHQAVALDNGILRTFNSGSNCTFTVLASAEIGTMYYAVNYGAGATVFAFGGDTEINSVTTGATKKVIACVKLTATTWVLIGDVS